MGTSGDSDGRTIGKVDQPLAEHLLWISLTPSARAIDWLTTGKDWNEPVDRFSATHGDFLTSLVANIKGRSEAVELDLSGCIEKALRNAKGSADLSSYSTITSLARAAFCRLGTNPSLLKKTDYERWCHYQLQTVAGDRLVWFLNVGDPMALADNTSVEKKGAASMSLSADTLQKLRTSGAERLSGIVAYWPKELIEFFDSVKGTTVREIVNKAAHALPARSNQRSRVAALVGGMKRGSASVIVGHVVTNFANAALGVKALSLVSSLLLELSIDKTLTLFSDFAEKGWRHRESKTAFDVSTKCCYRATCLSSWFL